MLRIVSGPRPPAGLGADRGGEIHKSETWDTGSVLSSLGVAFTCLVATGPVPGGTKPGANQATLFLFFFLLLLLCLAILSISFVFMTAKKATVHTNSTPLSFAPASAPVKSRQLRVMANCGAVIPGRGAAEILWVQAPGTQENLPDSDALFAHFL